MLTLKYVVTYRMAKDAPQQELTRYTKEAADRSAEQILEMGGVAVITEDSEDIPEHTTDDTVTNPSHKGTLDWN